MAELTVAEVSNNSTWALNASGTQDQDQDHEDGSGYATGVILALIGSSLQALGLSLWKLNHIRSERAEGERLAVSHQDGLDASHADDTLLGEGEGKTSAQEESLSPTPLLTYNDESMESFAAYNTSPQGGWGRERSDSCVSMSLDSNTDLEAIESVAGVCPLNASIASVVRTDTVDIVVERTGKGMGGERRITCECPWIWFVGSLVFAIGNGCDFVALGIAPQSVVTLVGSWCLVVNTMTAQCLLSEVTTRYDVLSSLVIICGIVLTVLPYHITRVNVTHVMLPSSGVPEKFGLWRCNSTKN